MCRQSLVAAAGRRARPRTERMSRAIRARRRGSGSPAPPSCLPGPRHPRVLARRSTRARRGTLRTLTARRASRRSAGTGRSPRSYTPRGSCRRSARAPCRCPDSPGIAAGVQAAQGRSRHIQSTSWRSLGWRSWPRSRVVEGADHLGRESESVLGRRRLRARRCADGGSKTIPRPWLSRWCERSNTASRPTLGSRDPQRRSTSNSSSATREPIVPSGIARVVADPSVVDDLIEHLSAVQGAPRDLGCGRFSRRAG